MAVTGKGDINFNTDNIKISGTLIPENIIDSFLTNIPIIGKIMLGGAAVGVKYTMEGSIDDPQVNANLLSFFAPGFLKNLFD